MNCPSCGHENIDGNDRCDNCLAPFRDLDVPRVDSAEGLALSVMEDNLGELHTDEVVCVAPDTPALEVARLMKNSNCGCALVVDGGKLVGIFTEHDVLLRLSDSVGASRRGRPGRGEQGAHTEDHSPGKLQFVEPMVTDHSGDRTSEASVKTLMTTNPECLNETDSVAEALNKMSLGRYRHIPFRKSDGTYGVASIKSVLKYIAQEDW